MSNKKADLNCADIVKYDDKLFILTRNTQVLFEYSMTENRLSLCGRVWTKLGQLFISMALCGKKIYIAPYEADFICIYNIEKRKFQRIPLGQIHGELQKKYYHMCFSFRNQVYFLGGSNSTMLCVDTETDIVKDIQEWTYEFKSKYGYETRVTTHTNVCIEDHCFWVTLKGDNILLQYNMRTGEHCFWKVGKKRIQYVTITYDGEYFWLSGDKRFIVRWKKESNEVREYDRFPEGFGRCEKDIGWKELFSCGYLWNKRIYFAPLNSNMLIKFDLKMEKMECAALIGSGNICPKIVKIDEKKLYIEEDDERLRFKRSLLIGMDGECGTKFIKLGEQDNIDVNILKKEIETGIVAEAHPLYLPLFLESMTKIDELEENRYQSSIGKKIIRNMLNTKSQ